MSAGRAGSTSLNRVSFENSTSRWHSARFWGINVCPSLFPVGTMSDSPTRRVLRQRRQQKKEKIPSNGTYYSPALSLRGPTTIFARSVDPERRIRVVN